MENRKSKFNQLNSSQKEAVTYPGGALSVLSCAGSGKTRVITHRIAYLIQEICIPPNQIYACTFTNQAATEMRERLAKMVGSTASAVNVSTIHSLAYRLWREGVSRYHPGIALPKVLSNEGLVRFQLKKFLEKGGVHDADLGYFLGGISLCKLRGITPASLKNRFEVNGRIDWEFLPGLTDRELACVVYEEYQKWLHATNHIDFADMLINFLGMLKNEKYSEYREMLQDNCEHLLMDEVQDTNRVSFEIMEILASKHKNVTVVGDKRQTIYSFQGANFQNLENFAKRFNPKVVNLDINYRSTSKIVENANALIAHADDPSLSAAQTPNVPGDKIEVISSLDLAQEGLRVLETIKEIKEKEGRSWNDIAILYRVNSQSRELEDQFLLNGIPYEISGPNFFDRKEINDVLTYLKIAIDNRSAQFEDFRKIVNCPNRFISHKSLAKISTQGLSFIESLRTLPDTLKGYEFDNYKKFHREIMHLCDYAKAGKKTSEIISYILNEIGYRKWASKQRGSEANDDIEMTFEALASSARKFSSPQEFLKFIERFREKRKEKIEDAVQMMTVHTAKGKEFPIVFVVGICDKTYPFYKAKTEEELGEERRVMYVAITRPKTRLYLCCLRRSYGKMAVKPSPYMKQMKLR